MRHFPQPEFSAFVDLYKMTSQISSMASSEYNVINTIYYYSTELSATNACYWTSRNILLTCLQSAMLEARSRFCEEKQPSHRPFFSSFTSAQLCFTLLTAIYTQVRRNEASVKYYPLCKDVPAILILSVEVTFEVHSNVLSRKVALPCSKDTKWPMVLAGETFCDWMAIFFSAKSPFSSHRVFTSFQTSYLVNFLLTILSHRLRCTQRCYHSLQLV